MHVGAALLTKIAQTLSNSQAGQVISFLPLAEGWDMKEVAFDLPPAAIGISEKDSVNLRGTFARRVNSVPVPGDIWFHSGTYLWDIYREVLEGAVTLADINQSIDEETRIQSARSIIGPPGQPTEKYQTYLLYRDKCRALELSFRQAELTLSHTTDPKLMDLVKVERDHYQSQLETANQEWIVNGYKEEIDEALYILSAAFAGNPLIRWNNWKKDFNLVAQQSDGSGPFWPTGYRPDQLYDQGIGWIKFTLTGSEVESLANSAPPEVLRTQNALGDNVRAEGEIEQVSMEMARIDVERTWFHPELFKSRFWKWVYPDQPLLSNGAQPWPEGILPGYIIGLVLVRNISITWKSVDNTTSTASNFRVLGNLAIEAKVFNKIGQPTHVLPLRGERIFEINNPGNVDPPSIEKINKIKIPTESISKIRMVQPEPFQIKPVQRVTPSALINKAIRYRVDLRDKILVRPDSEPSKNETNTSTTGNAVYLVAHIVQHTPKSPDPDLDLKWE